MTVNAIEKIRSMFEDLISNKRVLIRILSILLILMVALLFKVSDSEGSEIIIEESAAISDSEDLYVDIGGAVERPGVYKVEVGTRLYQVIEMAGGLKSDADTYSVNQASFVEDGAKIIIPATSDDPSQLISESVSSLININTADKEQLCTLNGIGDVIAERIIEYRASARFKTKEDIMSVNGIGSSIYEKIEDKITV